MNTVAHGGSGTPQGKGPCHRADGSGTRGKHLLARCVCACTCMEARPARSGKGGEGVTV